MKYNCLIVDDEIDLCQSIQEYFNVFDITSECAFDESACLALLDSHTFDLIILDINLAKKSGFELCKSIKKLYEIPIYFISARNTDDDIIKAYGVGGDDFITKPFSLAVLCAKVRAHLKSKSKESKIKLRPEEMSVVLGDKIIDLKPMEYKLLKFLMANNNRIVTKEEILKNVWGEGYYTENTLNVHINRLREKIEADPSAPKIILTVWGIGYKYHEE